MKRRLSAISVCSSLCLIVPSSLQAQAALSQRLDFQQRLNVHERPTVMFSSPDDRAAYFDGAYEGEWKFELNTTFVFDSNAQADAAGRSDGHWDYSASLVYDWWVSKEQGLVISPSVSMEGSRFDTYHDLEGHILASGLAVAVLDKLPVDLELSYLHGWGFDSDFDDQILDEHDVSLSIAKSLPLAVGGDGSLGEDGPSLEWRLGGGYVFSDPSLDDQAHGDASVEITLPINDRLEAILGLSLSYLSYPDRSALDRTAWLQAATAALEYRPVESKDLYLVAGVEFARRSDSDPAADYEQWLVSLGIRFEWEHVGFNLFKN
jgi:hypothetical protein